MCLLATFISSFMKYILKFFAHFLDRAVSLLLTSYTSVVYLLELMNTGAFSLNKAHSLH